MIVEALLIVPEKKGTRIPPFPSVPSGGPGTTARGVEPFYRAFGAFLFAV